MKLTWREFRDETGHYWESLPFIIRSFGVGRTGEITYRLEGPGIDSKSTDVQRLMTEAELESDRAEFRKRLGV